MYITRVYFKKLFRAKIFTTVKGHYKLLLRLDVPVQFLDLKTQLYLKKAM